MLARHVAVDPQTGNLIIAEHGGGRIQVFDPSGKFITQWNTGNADIYIVDLDIDRQGNVYVIYSANIHVLNAETGQEIATISEVGGNNAFFSNLATTDDGGFIAVSHGETLVRFNSDRTAEVLAPSAISSISGDSELDAKIAVDGVGNIYLLGIFNDSVFKFDSQGKFVTRFGSAGEEKGQFRAPHAIAVDNQSRVYVSDAKGLQVFEADGRYLDKFEVNGFVFGIDINDKNEIFTVANDQKVSKFIMKVP